MERNRKENKLIEFFFLLTYSLHTYIFWDRSLFSSEELTYAQALTVKNPSTSSGSLTEPSLELSAVSKECMCYGNFRWLIYFFRTSRNPCRGESEEIRQQADILVLKKYVRRKKILQLVSITNTSWSQKNVCVRDLEKTSFSLI